MVAIHANLLFSESFKISLNDLPNGEFTTNDTKARLMCSMPLSIAVHECFYHKRALCSVRGASKCLEFSLSRIGAEIPPMGAGHGRITARV